MKKSPLLPLVLLVAMLAPGFAFAQATTADTAYQAIVKIRTYIIGLDGFVTFIQSGTGVIIDPNGIVLTNNHVVTVKEPYDDSDKVAGYQVCLTTDISQEPACTYTARLIAKNADSDLALLQITPIDGSTSVKVFPYIEPLQSGSIMVSDEVRALGYPSVGGDTLSITKGIVSGKQTKYDENWLKIDAVTSFGSSGGALINADGKLVGVTSEVHSDLAGSLGYAIDVSDVLSWITSNKKQSATSSAIEQNIIDFTKKQQSQNVSNTFQFDDAGFSITKPPGWEFRYNEGDRLLITNMSDSDGGYVEVALDNLDFSSDVRYSDMVIKSQLVDHDALAVANFITDETTQLNGIPAKHIKISGTQNNVEAYFVPNQNYNVQLMFGYGKNDKDAMTVTTILNSIKVTPRPVSTIVSQFVDDAPSFSLAVNDDWHLRRLNSKQTPLEIYSKDFSSKAYAVVEKKTADTRSLTNDNLLQIKEKAIEDANAAVRGLNLTASIESKNAHVRLNDQAADVIQFVIKEGNLATGENLLWMESTIIPMSDNFITFSMSYYGSDQTQFNEKVASFNTMLASFSLSSTPTAIAPNDAVNDVVAAQSNVSLPVAVPEKATTVGSIADRMRGHILLQVQSLGEAWYVHPDTGHRYYMKDGATAYQMMRNFGLGITDKDLNSIPFVSSTDVMKTSATACNKSSTANRLKGKIVLQVQSHGEAWYIDPDKCLRIYMKDGTAAYTVMRYLGVGITNSDLQQIKTQS